MNGAQNFESKQSFKENTPVSLESLTAADRTRLKAHWDLATKNMAIMEALFSQVNDELHPDDIAEIEKDILSAAEEYTAFAENFDLPDSGVEYLPAEEKKSLERVAYIDEIVAVALNILKSKMETLGYEFNVIDSEAGDKKNSMLALGYDGRTKETEKKLEDRQGLVDSLFSDSDEYDFILAEPNSKGWRGHKKLGDLRADIEEVFKQEQVSKVERKYFYDTTFRTQSSEIRACNAELASEEDEQRRKVLQDRIKSAYLQIRDDLIALTMINRSERDFARDGKDNPPELTVVIHRELSDVKSDIDTARIMLSEFIKAHEHIDDFDKSEEYKRVESIIELIDSCIESDHKVMVLKLDRYLTELWESYYDLRARFAEVAPATTELDEEIQKYTDFLTDLSSDFKLSAKTELEAFDAALEEYSKAMGTENKIAQMTTKLKLSYAFDNLVSTHDEWERQQEKASDPLAIFSDEVRARYDDVLGKVKLAEMNPKLAGSLKSLEAFVEKVKENSKELRLDDAVRFDMETTLGEILNKVEADIDLEDIPILTERAESEEAKKDTSPTRTVDEMVFDFPTAFGMSDFARFEEQLNRLTTAGVDVESLPVYLELTALFKEAEAYVLGGDSPAIVKAKYADKLNELLVKLEQVTPDSVAKDAKAVEADVVEEEAAKETVETKKDIPSIPETLEEGLKNRYKIAFARYLNAGVDLREHPVFAEVHSLFEEINTYEDFKRHFAETGGDLDVITKNANISEKLTRLNELFTTLEMSEPEVVPTPEKPRVEKPAEDLSSYEQSKVELFAAKKAYREAEEVFTLAMKEYYADSSFWSRLSSDKKVLGINEELPDNLSALRDDYRKARAAYASTLNTALMERSAQTYSHVEHKDGGIKLSLVQNNVYSENSAGARQAFVRRYILKPQERYLAMQERTILSPKNSERLKNIMKTMAKHKWLMRAGVITAAGIAGGLSGGVGLALAGASWQGTKMLASGLAGAGAATLARSLYGTDVALAERNLNKKALSATGEFSIDKLSDLNDAISQAHIEKLGSEYGQAYLQKEKIEKTQRNAGIAAAVVAGGTTGFMTGKFGIDLVSDNLDVSPDSGKSNIGKVSEVGSDKSTMVEAVKMPQGPVVIKNINTSYITPEGEAVPALRLGNISFGPNANESVLGVKEKVDLIRFANSYATQIASEDIDITEKQFEAILYSKLEEKFGDTNWWKEAKFETVDVGEFTNLHAKEAVPAVPEAVADYTIKRGDTLEGIIKERLADKLKIVEESQRPVVLGRLYERLNSDPELLSDIGIKKDVHKIYTGDNLDLAALERELEKELDVEIIESLKSGPVSVEADGDAQSVPIKVVEKPTAPVIETKVASAVPNEAVPSAKSYVLPKINPMSGNYTEHPQYKTFAEELFGGARKYDEAIIRNVRDFEEGTRVYDPVDKWLRTYQSPYTQLSNMSVEGYLEFKNQPRDVLEEYFNRPNVSIKYDMYKAWQERIDGLIKTLPNKPTTTIEDLVKRDTINKEIMLRSKAS